MPQVSARDRAILIADKVVLFVPAVVRKDNKDLGVLMEDATAESGLTNT